MPKTYDAIVAGSGITGGWAAKELTERGLETLVLEAGRPIDPEHDYVEHVPPWQMRFRGLNDRRRLEERLAVQRRCYACDEWASKFFVDDVENPYTTAEDKPFLWIRGRQVGGRPFSVVHSLIYDAGRRRVTGVRVIDGETRREREFEGRIIFLCASAVESARILLNSATPDFPNGLANSSGELGRNLMDHIMGGGATGTIDGFDERRVIGRRPNGIYVPRFRNLNGRRSEFLRGYGFQGGAGRDGWWRGADMPGFGADFKRALRDPGPWKFTFYGFGECLPRADNYIEIDPEKVDAWGVPVLKIHCSYGDNEKALLKDMSITGAEMLAAAGARDIEPFMEDNPPGLVIHEMGTARMGYDAKTSVLNAYDQCHDLPNVFVTDGACMTSSACQNPSLTYMALTARAAAYAVEQLKRREL